MTEIFAELKKEYEAGGVAQVLQIAEKKLRDEKRHHELFEVLKMKSRQEIGLPLLHQENQKTNDEQQRALEDGLIAACRDVGFALLREGQVQDSWVYLRHLSDHQPILDAVSQLEVTEENLDQIVGLLLYEGLDSEAGYRLVLENYGTCNAITTIQQTMYGRPKEERQATGRLLVAHVHRELFENVLSHIEREEAERPAADSLLAAMQDRDYLLAEGAYHIDTSHLSSTIQIAIELTDIPSIELALDMAKYGAQLDQGLQYAGDPPFEDLYPTAIRWFEAQLGIDVENHVESFHERAKKCDAHQEGTFAIETYIDLLSRVGKSDAAISATIDLIPQGIQTTGRAPSLYDLSEQLGSFDRYRELCAERNDLLGFVISLER